jgi:hypothetical protein
MKKALIPQKIGNNRGGCSQLEMAEQLTKVILHGCGGAGEMGSDSVLVTEQWWLTTGDEHPQECCIA